jgi:hypothetical protein
MCKVSFIIGLFATDAAFGLVLSFTNFFELFSKGLNDLAFMKICYAYVIEYNFV